MRPLSLLITFTFVFIISVQAFSQTIRLAPTIYTDTSYTFAEVTGYGSTQQRTPFWLQANQFGIVSGKGSAASLHAGIEKFWNISPRKKRIKSWRLGGGIEAVSNFTPDVHVLLPQAFASLRIKNWELFAGRKKQWIGLADSTLGMGSYAWSTNAMPIPKIQIGTTGFVDVPLTRQWVAFNAFYSEGFFENNRAVTRELKLHQKALYLRLGRAGSKLRLYGGFNHQAQWGGISPYYTVNGRMPVGLKSYFYVITGKARATGNNLTHFDSTNRIGNHLGSIDLAMEITMRNSGFFLYRQNIYEDGSLYYLNNIADGLNGIRFRRKPQGHSAFQLTEAVVEFLYTKSQGGSSTNTNTHIRGKDDYFNNAQVRDGWSYLNRAIGSPFIPPTSDTRWNWPKYSDFFTSNNRVKVWNAGFKGTLLERIYWTGKLSYSENFGTYDVPFEGSPKQFSGLISFETLISFLGGTIIKASLAADTGKLYPKTYGASLGLRKNGILNLKKGEAR